MTIRDRVPPLLSSPSTESRSAGSGAAVPERVSVAPRALCERRRGRIWCQAGADLAWKGCSQCWTWSPTQVSLAGWDLGWGARCAGGSASALASRGSEGRGWSRIRGGKLLACADHPPEGGRVSPLRPGSRFSYSSYACDAESCRFQRDRAWIHSRWQKSRSSPFPSHCPLFGEPVGKQNSSSTVNKRTWFFFRPSVKENETWLKKT